MEPPRLSRGSLAPHLTVIIATFRRAEGLERVLLGLAKQSGPLGLEVRCIVVDNGPSATQSRQIVESMTSTADFPIQLIEEGREGVSWARNAGLEVALEAGSACRFVAFIDDDEVPEPQWLAELLRIQSETGASVVTGPVLAKFRQPPPKWVSESELFERERHPSGLSLPVAYTGNVLVKSELFSGPEFRFDPSYARGEDSELFRRIQRSGHTIVWADDAVVHEWLEPERTMLSVVFHREFIEGLNRTRIDLRLEPGGWTRLKSLGRSLTRLLGGAASLLFGLAGPYHGRIRALCTMAAGMGRLWATLNLPYRVPYDLRLPRKLLTLWSKRPHTILRVNTKQRVLAMTFDDGPDPKWTPAILEVLARHEVKATFFMVGEKVQAHPQVARAVLNAGHSIGNHTFSHPSLRNCSAAEVVRELRRCAGTFASVLGVKSSLMRPPYGRQSFGSFWLASLMGYRPVEWSISAEDFQAEAAEVLSRRVLEQAHPGAIVLMHDSWMPDLGKPRPAADLLTELADRTATIDALDVVLRSLEGRGYEFLTVPELLELENG